jgi:L-fuculose-phosphate aldolase
MLHIHSIQARDDIRAVIHSHSVSAITLSLIMAEIPPLSIEMAGLGAPIPTLGFELPGSLAFADKVAGFFRDNPDKKAVLLENHGAVAIGSSLKDAFQNAYNLETGADIFWKSMALGKKIRVLSQANLDKIHGAYADVKKSLSERQ